MIVKCDNCKCTIDPYDTMYNICEGCYDSTFSKIKQKTIIGGNTMSYKYGLNGNDLDWDMILTGGMGDFCVQCKESIYNILESVKCDLSADFFSKDSIDTILDCVQEEFYNNGSCDGHITCYYKSDKDFTAEEIIKAGGIEKLAEYGIFHDTNDNLVSTFGDVPDSIFTERYIAERDQEGV